MAEFKISRFRYTFKGDWSTSTAYNKDDVVKIGGSTYVCIRQHTSNSFKSDQEYLANESDTSFSPAWIKMTDGLNYRNEWQTSTAYIIGDVVYYGGNLWYAVANHTAQSTFDANISDWTIYSVGSDYLSNWSSATRYGVGDLVRYGGIVYRCITGHTSTNTTDGLESDIGNWSTYYSGIDYKGDWSAGTRYKQNDLVKYGGTIFRCIAGHVQSPGEGLVFDENTQWTVELPGFEYEGDWLPTVVYQVGDIVKHGGYLYKAIKNNFGSNPNDSFYQPISSDWQLLSKGLNFVGSWTASIDYKTGDVVSRGGNLYVALLNTTIDGSTLDYLDTSNWEKISEGYKFSSAWTEDAVYQINDVVIYRNNTWLCTVAHTSSIQNFPGDNGSGFNYWELIVESPEEGGLENYGDILTYDLFRSEIGDTSSFGPTDVPLGQQGQLISINSEDSIIYKTYGQVARVRYVNLLGVDDATDPQRGISPFKPWRTVRFACEQVDDGFEGTTTIRVGVGEFLETTPIIIPARTAIWGTELRSTTIKSAPAVEELASDSIYTKSVLDRIDVLLEDVLTGSPLTNPKTPGNAENPVIPTRTVLVNIGSGGSGQIVESVVQIIGTANAASLISVLIDDIKRYIDFFVNSTGTQPTLVSTNTAVTTEGILDSIEVLEANKDFFASEAVAYMIATFPEYNFVPDRCKRDVKAYIDAWKYDLLYTGNYKSLLAARYYRNAVLGSQSDDMFYCRDATGIRNCTLTGLTGTLTPPNVFDLYRLPTGAVFVSLDPGWGPEDERTWITTRSPYIQGVTNIGTGCVGMHVDGSLHDGGNKSMVANDFTQVLSDGVGAWVENNGRAELVSVFTYYCHVGYLSQDGGIIRGTNGNCSYGRFGAIADGVDLTETPKIATLNTREHQAQVASVFAGDFTDEIFLLEWEHAGQNYTQASASFTGSGVQADVEFDDFRDDALFESRLIDTSNNPVIPNVGGGGYTIVGNNAQSGNSTSITIATNDANTQADYLGMRLIITSGPGTGQYGYITAYDNVTKLVNVSRESDDQPGWDNVIPGRSTDILTTQTTYRIEPRVIFSAPEYAVTSHDMESTSSWSNIVFGDTYQDFGVITTTPGTGSVIEDDGLTAFAATFSVIKDGRDYIVSLVNGGAGYAIDDTITIAGDELGGTTPSNDIVITVTGTTDDSTNVITDFTFTGIAASGRFVVTTLAGQASVYSLDGETWESSTLPSSGDWKCLAYGNKKFVAIRNGSTAAASSTNGNTWTPHTMGATRNWNSVVYGNGKFVAVSGDQNTAAYSLNGESWTLTTMATIGDSSINEWVDVTYGKGLFVAIANSQNISASSADGITWEGHIMDVIADSSQKDWVSVTYGNNRFVAISSQGDVAYSFDGTLWSPATMPTQDGSTAHNWKMVRYGQGLFVAIGDTGSRTVGNDITTGPTNFLATSPDGIVWTTRELFDTLDWTAVGFGNPFIEAQDSTIGKSTPMWISVADGSNLANKIRTGKTALGRAVVEAGVISQIKIWDPGSGYQNTPTTQLISPNRTSAAAVENRLADGVLSNPSWINRGFGYRTATTVVNITGDGFADVYPVGKFITIDSLESYPGPGAQIQFNGYEQRYTLVTIEELGQGNNGLKAFIRISPEAKNRDNFINGTVLTIREQFSQVRISGHDFLDIGTGNFEETNYPELYSTGLYVPAPENEIIEEDGGRVYYTSTDQSGNFRVGELFAVEQATGIVTISADFFDLAGLSELRLGGIRVGGTGAVIREFSTDPLFIEDSNNIVPTQRAIAAYLSNRLSVGGAELTVGSFIAGTVLVGPNVIGNSAGLRVVFPVRADFDNEYTGITGSMLAQTMFFRSFSNEN